VDASLRAKLDSIADRHDELGTMLCDPEIVGDKVPLPRPLARARRDRPAGPGPATTPRSRPASPAPRSCSPTPTCARWQSTTSASCGARRDQLEGELQRLLLPRDPNDSRNVILEIRAGTGGEEAALFAADLWRMYIRHAERRGWSVEVMSVSDASAGGLKEITGLIRGKDVYAMLKFESGVHRVQRVPATEAQGRIHTSTATVAIMPEAEEIDIVINPKDIEMQTMRSSGSGGQSVNTTDSAVRLTHLPTGLAVHCSQEKSQTKNRDIAMRLLRSRLLDREIQKYQTERAAQRKGQIGTGDRAEKVRTYNYPQDRISDHRIGLTRHALDDFMDGDIDDVIAALRASDEAQRLAEAQSA
jgi:peptide chain release factor 1